MLRIEPALIAYLSDQLAPVPVTAELVNDHPYPIVHLERISGGYDGFLIDAPVIDIDAYAQKRGDAELLSHRVLDALLDARGQVVGGIVITYVNVETAPRIVPGSDNPAVRRYGATYQLGAHSA